jgi:hypothetical protein
MDSDKILAAIDAEIARLRQVREVLLEIEGAKPPAKQKSTNSPAKGKKSRVLSPEARKRIADAQRKRWIAAKKKSRAKGGGGTGDGGYGVMPEDDE